MKLRWMVCGVVAAALGAHAHGQDAAAPPAESCLLQKSTYVCDPVAMRRKIAMSQKVSLDYEPRDLAAEKNLLALARHLGKIVVERPDAELILSLRPVPNSGFVVGPTLGPLAQLNVLSAGHEGAKNQLVWSETYTGEANRPWLLTLGALVTQFEDRLKQ